jgi:molybdate transport system substrate-binding protein
MSANFLAAVNIGAIILLLYGFSVNAAEVKVMAGGPLAAVFKELGPQFERDTGHKIVARFSGTAVVKEEIDAGDAFDLVITNASAVDGWIKEGKISAVTRVSVAHAGLGVGVRAGFSKPDVSSVVAARRALLDATTIGHGSESASATSFRNLLDRLGIASEVKSKLRPMGLGMPYKSVAAGEVELIVAVVPGIVAAPGVDLAGSFPPELQTYVGFAAGVSAGAKEPGAAQALINFLMLPVNAVVIKAKGLEPGAPR